MTVAQQGQETAKPKPPRRLVYRKYANAVIVEPKDLRRLDQILRPLSPGLTYGVDLIDKSTLRFHDVESLLAFDNSKAEAITQLEVESDYSGPGNVKVEIRSQAILFEKAVTFRVGGPTDLVAKARDEFETWIAGIEQSRSYSWFARQQSFTLGLLLAAVLFGSFGIRALVVGQSDGTERSTWQRVIAGAIGGSPFVLGWILDRFRAAYWPLATFTIGQGERRHKMLESSRNIWFLGIIIPLVMTIGGGLLL